MKIDEIKELILSNRSTQAKEPAVDLIFRAVRQLKQALIDGEGKAIFRARAAVGLMDHDVLGLLETEDA